MGIETKIKRLFVLMLENRSFDNLLGWSDLRGWQPDGTPTQADTLVGKQPYINTSIDAPQRSVQHPIGHGAPFRLNFDPGHEFSDVLVQLCRDAAANIPGSCVKDTLNLDAAGTYPSMSLNPNQLGYAECMQEHGLDIASALTCFTPNQLPVINFLASQFAVCDRWFSSMPGPTLPNRFFALAGTSWGIDYSPSDFSVIDSEFFTGKFGTGSDSLLTRLAPEEWLVAYGDTPLAWTLNGVGDDVHRARFIRQQELINSLKDGHLDDSVKFVFIEPHYDPIGSFRDGESMHPTGDVRKGEALIKSVYEAFKNSKYWLDSALLITFDEHGGFFDHVIPDPNAGVVPVLAPSKPTGMQHNFQFDRYGIRVPAIVVSPFVRQATIDHTFYDHLSIAKTLADIARPGGAVPLLDTDRFRSANSFAGLFTLSQPRAAADIPECPPPVPMGAQTAPTAPGPTARVFSNVGWPPDPLGGA